ncbi:MAG: hypothetical protein IBJ10_10415, partial [Phycisphaerales bacterium]|nr:hypothetical protein [Phycisphaerales bacterium]
MNRIKPGSALGLVAAMLLGLATSPAQAAYALTYGIFMRWHEGAHAIVIGALRLDSPADLKAQVPARYSLEVDSVVFGDPQPGAALPLRHAYAVGLPLRAYRLPVGEKTLFLLNRAVPPLNDGQPEWAVSDGPYDFMGTEGVPFCRLGPEADAILRDVPRMIEIAALRGAELKRQAVWEEWRKGEMRRSLGLGWITFFGLNEPKGRGETLDFF